jgi:hypothetical protein
MSDETCKSVSENAFISFETWMLEFLGLPSRQPKVWKLWKRKFTRLCKRRSYKSNKASRWVKCGKMEAKSRKVIRSWHVARDNNMFALQYWFALSLGKNLSDQSLLARTQITTRRTKTGFNYYLYASN